ncbi:Methyltransferase domain-containing protein [Desulfocicer vacuolatum DSM 3385]|uniref:Methyltransferase domain-containing protein n=1 Tax=Desulfocicer vacuolatum DSM 3385 TaxID=1121400 RepID=A0A1W2CHH8_9BACT|nr:class I SAM-dependent methyltransferase [Desulfocicer vacuolatum]SMC84516.1 Methyltransferase domain-containing protein [Desulfocicer vacuolatum DSM 3385]
MGYIFDFNDTNAYKAWCNKAGQIHDFKLQTALMMKMLSPLPDRSVLDIGCGDGRCFAPLGDHGLQVTGVDPSPYMLDLAMDQVKGRVELHRGFAEDLPFEDNTFNYSILMNSLEFMDRPAKAIEEACRVTRDKIFIGVFNRYAPLNILRRAKGLFCNHTLSHARFFGIWELKKIIHAIMGPVPVSWNTTLLFPFSRSRPVAYLEKCAVIQKSPWGTIVGMTIIPIPRFRTRPLSLRIHSRRTCGPVTGFARERTPEKHEDTFI